MSKKKDADELKLVLDDYQEIEDYTVDDVFEIVEEEQQKKMSKKQQARIKQHNKRKKKRRVKIILLILEILVVLILGMVALVMVGPESVRNKIISCTGMTVGKITGIEDDFNNRYNDDSFNNDDIDVNDGIDKEQYEEYITLALFGLDSRDGSLDVGQSDTIIIATINTVSKEVRMSSIARDTYMSIIDDEGDQIYRKITDVFGTYGLDTCISNLNRNLDLSIDEYAIINFGGLATMIDAFGGIDVNITEDERFYINGYLTETRKVTGMDAPDVYQSGRVHLTGLQATAFCRIRQVTFTDEDGTQYIDDFGRTARQRYVIRYLINSAKNLGVDNVMAIAKELFGESTPVFKTSLSYNEIMDMLPLVLGFSLGGTESFPYTYEEGNKALVHNGASVIVAQGLSYNVTKLHEFLYPDETYKPTVTLKNISNDLAFRLGVEEIKLPEDQ